MKQQDLEQALRASLAARADDVVPDPAAYQRVVARGERSRRLRLAATGFAVAGLVAVAAVAVTSLVRGANVGFDPGVATQPPDTEVPSSTLLPTAEPSQSASADPSNPSVPAPFTPDLSMLTTDGESLVFRDPDGSVASTVVSGGPGAIAGLTPRPRPSASDIVVVYLQEVDGCGELVWIRAGVIGPDRGEARSPGEPVDDSADEASCATTPVFAPDGLHLAWLEYEPGRGALAVQTIAWDDEGPVPGSEAGFGLPEAATVAESVRLVDWHWLEMSAEATTGVLRYAAVDRHGGGESRSFFEAPIERQRDGAIALPGDSAAVGAADGVTLAADGTIALRLAANEGGGGCPVCFPGDPVAPVLEGLGDPVIVPREVLDGWRSGTGPWLSSEGGVALVGDGVELAWLVHNGLLLPLDGVVVHGALVPAGEPADPTTAPVPDPETPTLPTPDPSFSEATAEPTTPASTEPTSEPSEVASTPPPSPEPTAEPDPDPTAIAMPPHVAETAQAIRDAAASQDWEALAALLPQEGDFTSNYGGQSDHIAYWQDLEAEGTEIRVILQDILALEPAVTEGGFWVWPAEFATAETYLDYRVGIDEAGVWRFFVGG